VYITLSTEIIEATLEDQTKIYKWLKF
jgi:hypothetical protein